MGRAGGHITPPAKPGLQPVTLDATVLESEKIDGFLNGMSYAGDARGIILPNVKFYDSAKKDYVSAVGDPSVVTDDSIRRVSIELGAGKTRFFQQIDYMDGSSKEQDPVHGSDTRIKVTAWQEIDSAGKPVKLEDGKQEIRINFTGFTGSGGTDETAPKTKLETIKAALVEFIPTLNNIDDGKMNTQVLDAVAFTDRVIEKVGKNNISNLIYGAHSIGAGNALAAHALSDLEGVPTKTALLIEPGAADQQLRLIKKALNDPDSDLFQTVQAALGGKVPDSVIKAESAKLDKDMDHVTSIRFVNIDKDDGDVHGSNVGNLRPAHPVVGFLFGGTRVGAAREIFRQTVSGDDLVLEGGPKDNRMVGHAILQDVSDAPKIATTSAMGGVDPIHMLAPGIAGAAPGVYYAGKSSTMDEVKAPSAMIAQTEPDIAGPHGKGRR